MRDGGVTVDGVRGERLRVGEVMVVVVDVEVAKDGWLGLVLETL